jgi:hypothetical protein
MNLTPAALNWLGSAFGKKTKVSPFANTPNETLTQAGLDDLRKQGVVTAENAMTTEAYALLDILAGATRFASVHLSGGSGQVNRVTYWSGDKIASLDNTGSSLIVSDGNDMTGIEAMFREMTGSNRLVNSTFTGNFDHRSALIFTALLDLSRQAAIRLYVDGTPVPKGFSAAQVSSFAGSANNTRWVTSYLKTLKIPGLTVSKEQAETGLKSLADAGIVRADGGGLYTLAYESAVLAARFLFIENTIHFTAGSENGIKVNIAECLFIQAGIHDAIMIDVSSKGIGITSLSSLAMIDAIKRMMTTPPAF